MQVVQLDNLRRLYQDLIVRTTLRDGRLVGIAPASAFEAGGDGKGAIAS